MLVRQARAVLDFNWTGEYTMPGPRLYPHQWSWDAAFIAIGYSHYDQERATRGLRHLFEAQWKNGLLPQLVFNPHFTNIMVRCSHHGPTLDVSSCERIFDEPVDGVWASDHFGVVAELSAQTWSGRPLP
jgi:hypothetical protein